jgi:hypothetical protein
MDKARILQEFKLFSVGTDGIGNWLSSDNDDRVFDRLERIAGEPLSKVQLNQLLAFGHEAPQLLPEASGHTVPQLYYPAPRRIVVPEGLLRERTNRSMSHCGSHVETHSAADLNNNRPVPLPL